MLVSKKQQNKSINDVDFNFNFSIMKDEKQILIFGCIE